MKEIHIECECGESLSVTSSEDDNSHVVSKCPDCSDKGRETRYCSVCGETLTEDTSGDYIEVEPCSCQSGKAKAVLDIVWDLFPDKEVYYKLQTELYKKGMS